MNIFSIEDGKLKRNDWKRIENYQGYELPILYLTGSIAGISKDNKVTLRYIYQDKSGTCTLKWQGASSVNLPKKNYTINFDQDFEAKTGWGSQKKYVLKANFVDSSHARNIICAKLWGQMVKSRTVENTLLKNLPNGGAIDGFPVIISLNGEFHGLYTWNIPKDDWMFNMDGTGQQAIVCAELNNNGAVAFKALATMEPDANGQLDFDLEYSSDDNKDWVLASLNRLIGAVKDSDGTNITYGITPYLDWDSAIDYYCHAALTANYDGIYRNYLLATYDGIKWFFTGYDMDVVLGLRAMGKYFYPATHENMSFTSMAAGHKLWALIWKYKRPELRARYNEICKEIMSVENVANMFVDFIADIPLSVYVDDVKMWNSIPSSSANNLSQIITYYDFRRRNVDEWIKDTSGETALPTQINPNFFTISNNLTNCSTSNNIDTIEKNEAYNATIIPNDGYEISEVLIKMDGVDITSTSYNGNVISIASVTGNISITIIATKKSGYTNLVSTSIDTDNTIYDSADGNPGWKSGVRISGSSGVVKDATYSAATGFMPVTPGATIKMRNTNSTLIWDAHNAISASNCIAYYQNDANKTWLGSVTIQPANYGICTSTDIPTGTIKDGGIVTTIVPNNASIGLMRISCSAYTNDISGLEVIVNEDFV